VVGDSSHLAGEERSGLIGKPSSLVMDSSTLFGEESGLMGKVPLYLRIENLMGNRLLLTGLHHLLQYQKDTLF